MQAITKTGQALVIKPDGSKFDIMPDNGRYFVLKELQKLVGGFIELVHLPETDQLMVVNEEGKLQHLQYNPGATRVLYQNFPDGVDYICGWAVICDKRMMR